MSPHYERLAYHLDSLLAIALLLYSVWIAVWINHEQARRRAVGLWLAGAGCAVVCLAIVGLDIFGAFGEMRPHRYWIDPHKPIVMRVLAGVFAIAAVMLIKAARAEKRTDNTLALTLLNTADGYGRVSRFLHWTIAILFLSLIPMGIFQSMLPYDTEYRHALYVIHKSVGLTLLVLAVFRVFWLLRSPASLAAGLSIRDRLLARTAHITLYLFLLLFPLSGFVLGTSLGKISYFYIWDLPLLWGKDEASLAWGRWAHKIILPFTFYVVFLGHLLGAFKHRFLPGHANTVKRMVT